MEQLSGTDSLFLYQEKGNNYNHVAALGIYDPSTAPGGKVRFKDILNHFRNRLDVHKLFRRLLVTVPHSLDRPYWIDGGEIDIEYHVRHIALPFPGDWRQLMIQVARIHSRPLDRSRPLWEAYVIEGLDRIPGLPVGSFALFIKFHHASVDGQAAGRVLASLHSSSADAEPRSAENTIMSEREPNALEMYTRAVPHTVSRALNLAKFSFGLAKKVGSVAASKIDSLRAPDSRKPLPLPEMGKAPPTRFNQMVSANRVVEAVGLPLAAMKEIRAQVPGSTVNDIFLTVVGGALRKYLNSKDELPEQSLTALMPISLRNDGRKAAGGNDVGGAAVLLHSEIANPLDRLEAVYRNVRKTQEGLETLGRDFLQSFMESLPNYVTDKLMRHALLPQFNTAVSNVRGPDTPWYVSGARLVHFYPVSIATNYVGLNHTCFSYNGTMWLSAVACRNMMPDPGFYAECLRESFAELVAASAGSKAGAAATGQVLPRKKASTPAATARLATVKPTAKTAEIPAAKTAVKAAGKAAANKVSKAVAKAAAKPAPAKAAPVKTRDAAPVRSVAAAGAEALPKPARKKEPSKPRAVPAMPAAPVVAAPVVQTEETVAA
ncbi:MAG: wax ester/triacylglycerol synthase family O-acyltransferase [Pseudomonadota bacterium]